MRATSGSSPANAPMNVRRLRVKLTARCEIEIRPRDICLPYSITGRLSSVRQSAASELDSGPTT